MAQEKEVQKEVTEVKAMRVAKRPILFGTEVVVVVVETVHLDERMSEMDNTIICASQKMYY